MARNKPYFSFQLSLPFGPPAVLRLEVPVSVNGIGINAKNLPYTAHPKKNICMMNQELTARKRSPIKALYVLLRYVIALLLDGSDKRQLVSACSIIEVQDCCKPIFFLKGKQLSNLLTAFNFMYDQ